MRSRGPYVRLNSTIWSTVSVFSPRIYLHIADATSIRHIVADRHKFPKPLELYRILSVYGENVLITEGDEWRKHRKIVGSTFTDATNELDWVQSTRVTKAWMEHLSKTLHTTSGMTEEEDIPKVCLHLALNVICATAFGVSIPAPGEKEDRQAMKAGHRHTFKETVEGALETLFITVATPKWLSWLPLHKFTEAKIYKAELDSWMSEIVRERRSSLANGEERKDLLSALVQANDALRIAEAKEAGIGAGTKSEVMDEDELIGNMFIFLIAGHETSAHTLAFALGLLALYSDEQEALYQEIQEVEPDAEADIPYKAFPKFKRVMAVLQETLRMYPSVIGERSARFMGVESSRSTIGIPKMLNTQEDTIMPCSERGPYGQTQLFVPKGTHMSIDVQSLHHDRRLHFIEIKYA